MASFNKVNLIVEHLAKGDWDLLGTNPGTDCDVLRIALARSTDPPAATDSTIADITQPTGTGYATATIPNQSGTRAAAVFTLIGDQVVFTAGAGDWQTFRYVMLYDDTVNDDLFGWWDYGADLPLGNGETFTWKPNNQASGGTILTLTAT